MKKGYTLIEILVVIAIISILFTAGYANFQDYSRQQAILSVVRSIGVDLHTTEEYAIAGNIPTGCSNTLNGYQFKALSASSYEIDASCTGGTVQIKQVSLPAGITMSIPSPNPIIFKSLAQGTNIVSGANASIILTQSVTGNTKTITIGANGNVQ